MLRDNELTCLVVMERAPNGESQLLGNEGFLVDGIVVLGLDRSRGKLVRYLQVEKMRSVDHSMEKHAIEVRKGGLTVLGPIFEAGGDSLEALPRRRPGGSAPRTNNGGHRKWPKDRSYTCQMQCGKGERTSK